MSSLGPSDAIWRQRSGSTLAQVMACCLTVPSHFLNQCWLIISKVEWNSSKGKFTKDNSVINHWNYLEVKYLKFHSNFPGANELNGPSFAHSMRQNLHCVTDPRSKNDNYPCRENALRENQLHMLWGWLPDVNGLSMINNAQNFETRIKPNKFIAVMITPRLVMRHL